MDSWSKCCLKQRAHGSGGSRVRGGLRWYHYDPLSTQENFTPYFPSTEGVRGDIAGHDTSQKERKLNTLLTFLRRHSPPFHIAHGDFP